MIRERIELTPEEARVLASLTPLRCIIRPGFAGYPFRLETQPGDSFAAMPVFAEETILTMIGKGWLRVGQQTHVTNVPFSAMLSSEGERLRVSMLKRAASVSVTNGRGAAA